MKFLILITFLIDRILLNVGSLLVYCHCKRHQMYFVINYFPQSAIAACAAARRAIGTRNGEHDT